MLSEAAKEAKRARNRAWKKANAERVRAQRRARYKANPERALAQASAWKKANLEKALAQARARYKANPDYQKIYGRKKNTGWSQEAFDLAWTRQEGKCANDACRVHMLPRGNRPTSVAADHCHETGKLRELLCHRCNRWEGLLRLYRGVFEGLGRYQKKWEFNRETPGG